MLQNVNPAADRKQLFMTTYPNGPAQVTAYRTIAHLVALPNFSADDVYRWLTGGETDAGAVRRLLQIFEHLGRTGELPASMPGSSSVEHYDMSINKLVADGTRVVVAEFPTVASYGPPPRGYGRGGSAPG